LAGRRGQAEIAAQGGVITLRPIGTPGLMAYICRHVQLGIFHNIHKSTSTRDSPLTMPKRWSFLSRKGNKEKSGHEGNSAQQKGQAEIEQRKEDGDEEGRADGDGRVTKNINSTTKRDPNSRHGIIQSISPSIGGYIMRRALVGQLQLRFPGQWMLSVRRIDFLFLPYIN
jgi:hypothetical protein